MGGNVSEKEFNLLKPLISSKEVIIQKTDIFNSVAPFGQRDFI